MAAHGVTSHHVVVLGHFGGVGPWHALDDAKQARQERLHDLRDRLGGNAGHARIFHGAGAPVVRSLGRILRDAAGLVPARAPYRCTPPRRRNRLSTRTAA